MNTTFENVDIVFNHLKTSSLKSAISGSVYKYNTRPHNSVKEDVTINGLPVINSQFQSSIVNVNIFVPDLIISTVGVQTRAPNHVRLKALAEIAETDLEAWTDSYNFEIRQQTLIEDDASSCHYINIRLELNSINITN